MLRPIYVPNKRLRFTRPEPARQTSKPPWHQRWAEFLINIMKIVGGVLAISLASWLCVLVALSFSGRAVTIEPFSVPENFAKLGYKGDTATLALREMLTEASRSAQLEWRAKGYSIKSGDFHVSFAGTSISLDVMKKFVRSLLFMQAETTISGAFVSSNASDLPNHLIITISEPYQRVLQVRDSDFGVTLIEGIVSDLGDHGSGYGSSLFSSAWELGCLRSSSHKRFDRGKADCCCPRTIE